MTTADHLKKAFDGYCPLPITFWNAVFELGEIVTIGKEIIVKKQNETEHYLNFLIHGSGGILLWNKSNYICTDLFLKGEFFCDYYSFIEQRPTPYEVLTFEKSVVFRVSYSNLISFTNEDEYGDKFWRYAIQALYLEKHNQYIQSSIYTAEEIYQIMLEHQPEIVQTIPQKYIASFLRITPQSLSRIRRIKKSD